MEIVLGRRSTIAYSYYPTTISGLTEVGDRLSCCSAVAWPEGCRNRSAGLQQHKGKAGLGMLLVIELLFLPSVGSRL